MKKKIKGLVHPVDAYVGSKLRAARQERGLSQEKVASEVGVTFQQIQKYEKGSNRISCSKLYELASLFDIDVANFFDGLNLANHYRENNPKSRNKSASSLLGPDHNTQGNYSIKSGYIGESLRANMSKELSFIPTGDKTAKYSQLSDSVEKDFGYNLSDFANVSKDLLKIAAMSPDEVEKIMPKVQNRDLLYVIGFLTKEEKSGKLKELVLQVLGTLFSLYSVPKIEEDR